MDLLHVPKGHRLCCSEEAPMTEETPIVSEAPANHDEHNKITTEMHIACVGLRDHLDRAIQKHHQDILSELSNVAINQKQMITMLTGENNPGHVFPDPTVSLAGFPPAYPVQQHSSRLSIGKPSSRLSSSSHFGGEKNVRGPTETELSDFRTLEAKKKAGAVEKSFQPGFTSTSDRQSSTSNWLQTQYALRTCVFSHMFANFVVFMIFADAMCIAIEIDQEVTAITLSASAVFALFFTVEILLRFLGDGPRLFFLGDTSIRDALWNIFDAFLVFAGWLSFLADILEVNDPEREADTFTTIGTTRVLRTARIGRALRVMRIMRDVTALRVLVIAIGQAIHDSIWMLMLLSMNIYTFSAILSQCVTLDFFAPDPPAAGAAQSLLQKHSNLKILFGTLPRAMDTLFQSIAGGLSWREASQALSVVHPIVVLIFTVYVAFSFLIMLNIMTGLFCQTAIASAMNDEQARITQHIREKNSYKEKLRKLFKLLDDFGGDSPEGIFTLDELERCLMDERIQARFASLEIETEDAWNLFKLIDIEDKGYVESDAFFEGCLKCHGSSSALDTQLLRYEVGWIMTCVAKIAENMATVQASMMAKASISSTTSPKRGQKESDLQNSIDTTVLHG